MKKKEESATLSVQEEAKPVVAEQSKKRGRPTKSAEAVKVEVKSAPSKKSTARKAKPASVEPKTVAVEQPAPALVEQHKDEAKPVVEKKKFTLNQEFNLLVGFLAIAIMVVLCVTFHDGGEKLSGWELILRSGLYSGVFKGLMVFYVITLFVDCALAVKIDSENKILNIIEEVLYAVTLTANLVVGVILFTLIKNIGFGLIMFGILSLVSIVIKLARIYSK